MNKIYFYISTVWLLLAGCAGGGTQAHFRTEKETAAVRHLRIADTSYVPRNLEKGIPFRGINSAKPPLKVNLQDQRTGYADFDAADYFKKASVRILEYPADSGEFVRKKWLAVNSSGYASMMEATTFARLCSGNFIVADAINGAFQYDSLGKYAGTIHKADLSAMKYNKRQKMLEVPASKYESWSYLSCINDYYVSAKPDSARKMILHVWDLKEKKTVAEKTVNSSHPAGYSSINDTLKYLYRKTLYDKTPERTMLFMFNEKGDTLARYKDYFPVDAGNRGYTSADVFISYYAGNDFYFRQPYNDTIFKVLSAIRIEPAYIPDFGKRKMDIQTGYFGDKSGSLVPWMLTDLGNELLIVYSLNYDCPKTRHDGTVRFYYALYDKKTGSVRHLDMKETYPEKAWLPNSLPGSLPAAVSGLRPDRDGKVAALYFKEDLEELMNSPSMQTFSTQQQQTIRDLHGKLNSRKIAIMVLE